MTTKPSQDETYRGGTELLGENQIPSGRVEVVAADASNPNVNVGDVFQGATIGPVDYSQFGGYVIAATTLGIVQSNTWRRLWPLRRVRRNWPSGPTTSKTSPPATRTRSSSAWRRGW